MQHCRILGLFFALGNTLEAAVLQFFWDRFADEGIPIVTFPSWVAPLLITIWMVVWVVRGRLSGGNTVMLMRGLGGVLLTVSVWLIWWLTYGIYY